MAKSDVVIAFEKGYRICKDGFVTGVRGNILSNNQRNKGYKRFTMKVDGKDLKVPFHQLQAFAKFGRRFLSKGIVVRHLNGNSLDNSWSNIAIGTHSQNMMDQPKEVRQRKANRATSFVRRKDWPTIEADWESGMGFNKLSKKYSMSKGTLSYHFKNKTRKVEPKRVEYDWQAIFKDRDAGMSYSRLRVKHGVPATTLQRHLAKRIASELSQSLQEVA